MTGCNLLTIHPGQPLHGELRVSGDKSISHRALMLGALATGQTRISGFLAGADCLATLRILRQLGVSIEPETDTDIVVTGVGLSGFTPPNEPLDCGNSGTSMRLLTGILAGQPFSSSLTGDASLQKRPMQRVIEPLQRMGVQIESSQGCAPLEIHGRSPLKAIDYELPIASAQVKSAILLAGLFAEGTTRVSEPAPARDHTERMLQTFGCPVTQQGRTISLTGGSVLKGTSIAIPADLSSAAFFMVAAAITPDSAIVLRDIGINPTRHGVIDILCLMGADIALNNKRQWGNEPVADISVRYRQLHGITIPPELVPLAIDEFPAILAAAAVAQGETVLTGAAELRVKESDRLTAMADGLQALGIEVELQADGIRITGGQPQAGEINSFGDHRIAMAFAMLGNRATGPVTIHDTKNIATSFPGFVKLAQAAGLNIAPPSP
ncbi:MAG TPA: 3-phosphoshikimate 1-carboxyvinyltransferase [Gammaproteobacteria bacterium]|nr:3-phosphoshikimate 1-carboxyvinyltransferase [Gammaproteobacteria bacterium]